MEEDTPNLRISVTSNASEEFFSVDSCEQDLTLDSLRSSGKTIPTPLNSPRLRTRSFFDIGKLKGKLEDNRVYSPYSSCSTFDFSTTENSNYLHISSDSVLSSPHKPIHTLQDTVNERISKVCCKSIDLFNDELMKETVICKVCGGTGRVPANELFEHKDESIDESTNESSEYKDESTEESTEGSIYEVVDEFNDEIDNKVDISDESIVEQIPKLDLSGIKHIDHNIPLRVNLGYDEYKHKSVAVTKKPKRKKHNRHKSVQFDLSLDNKQLSFTEITLPTTPKVFNMRPLDLLAFSRVTKSKLSRRTHSIEFEHVAIIVDKRLLPVVERLRNPYTLEEGKLYLLEVGANRTVPNVIDSHKMSGVMLRSFDDVVNSYEGKVYHCPLKIDLIDSYMLETLMFNFSSFFYENYQGRRKSLSTPRQNKFNSFRRLSKPMTCLLIKNKIKPCTELVVNCFRSLKLIDVNLDTSNLSINELVKGTDDLQLVGDIICIK